MQRLDKFISENSPLSRSEIRLLARRGKITINGAVERAFDTKIDPEKDEISVGGDIIKKAGFVYIVINKPKGVISASNDKNARTVVDLVPSEYKHLELFPVGRLDKDTTGLLIITNDGEFAHKVISPKNDVPKCYEAELDGDIDPSLIEKFAAGVTLNDGSVCRSAKLEIAGERVARLTITEGKYHQVKRMFGVFDLGVNSLHRLSIGDLSLPNDLAQGESFVLSANEIINKVLKS